MHTYIAVGIRTALAYAALILLTRLIGRREISHLTLPDFITSLAMGTVAGSLAIGNHTTVPHVLLSLALWAGLTIATDWASMKFRSWRVLVTGGPTVVVENGRILEHRMRQLRYTTEDLLSQLRQQGIYRMEDVEFAIVESSGQLSVLPKSQHRPVTPADLAIPTQYQGISVTLVMDGQIRERNLALVGLSQEWLLQELGRRGLDASEVFLAQLDTSGHLYVDVKDVGT